MPRINNLYLIFYFLVRCGGKSDEFGRAMVHILERLRANNNVPEACQKGTIGYLHAQIRPRDHDILYTAISNQ